MIVTSMVLSLVLVSQPWPNAESSTPLSTRIKPPDGYKRMPASAGSFGAWLRNLPIKEGHPLVRLHNGQLKGNQSAQFVVLDIDVGKKNLQQCADAVMRLRAEYLWTTSLKKDICFRFTSGDKAKWSKWAAGIRPKIKGNKVSWSKRAKKSHTYSNFRRYLNSVFMYAGTYSLQKELKMVSHPSQLELGDVFIQGGFPGHAVIVVDVAINQRGIRKFLLAQSYMPAQEIHILRAPGRDSPWYLAKDMGKLQTPEWAFRYENLKRFSSKFCP